MNKPLRILSLGAGVQSSTLALMIARGELPMVDGAVFADTGDEGDLVYDWLSWLENQLPYPVHRVSNGRLSVESTTVRISKGGRGYLRSSVPVHIENLDGGAGMWQRHCTREHKIDPINKFIRKLAQVPRGAKDVYADVLIGISLDEAIRMKPSPHAWLKNSWPLVDMRVTRQGCIDWMERNGYPKPPRSACVFCPYKSDAEWISMKMSRPGDFAAAIKYERDLQFAFTQASALTGTPYLHSTRQPLEDVDFTKGGQRDMFGNECEGMCGV
jgi:hypothetical protein